MLAVLPGLDEESSEFYGRSKKLLDNIAEAVQDLSVFATSLWRALLSSPPMRLAASHYIRSRFSSGMNGTLTEMISDVPLVAYAITCALSDENTLTQRSVLDLLLGQFALDSQFFQCRNDEHREAAISLVSGVFGAVIRRDLSLTKRVHAWLLGGLQSDKAISFCERNSKDLVLAAFDAEIESCLAQDHQNPKTMLRPIRIATALLDRDELSHCLGHHFALLILRYGMLTIVDRNNEYERDLRAAITELVQDLGSARVFDELERTLSDGGDKKLKDFKLLVFALSIFPTKSDVVRTKHLPKLLGVAVNSLNAESTDSLTLENAVAFCSGAVRAMGLSKEVDESDGFVDVIKSTASSFASFFVAWLAHVIEPAPVELRRAYSDVTDSEEHAAELRMSSVHETRKECISLAKGACSFFVSIASSGIGGEEVIRSAVQATAKCASAADVRISLAGSEAFANVSAYTRNRAFDENGYDEQALGVIRRCWRQMHPSLRTAMPQSAQIMLRLQAQFPEESKAVIADGVLSHDLPRRIRNLERFACLWRLAVEHRLMPLPAHSQLFLMLDALVDEDWGPKMLARSWLSDALLADAASVIDAPLRLLLTPESRTNGPNHEFSAVYDAPRALYAFQVLRAILESCATIMGTSADAYAVMSPRKVSRKDGKRGQTGIQALAALVPTARTSQLLSSCFGLEMVGDKDGNSPASLPDGPVALNRLLPAPNYIVAIALTCLGYLRGQVPEQFRRSRNAFAVLGDKRDIDPCSEVQAANGTYSDIEWTLAGLGPKPFPEQHSGVCAAAAECLATLLASIRVPSQLSVVVSDLLAEPILCLIHGKMGAINPVLELHFLTAMTFLVTAHGPCYSSSVHGKGAFTKSDIGSRRMSYSESQLQLFSVQHGDRTSQRGNIVAVDSLGNFVPWLLGGVISMCGPSREHDRGSQEVLGVRRKWIQFMETTVRHTGVKLPVVAEGLLLILSLMLKVQKKDDAVDTTYGDNEFSRVDETLLLLEGIGVVSANVLWSFEYALASGDLKDDTQASEAIMNSDLATLQETEREQNERVSGSSGRQSNGAGDEMRNRDGNDTATSSARDRMTTATNATAAMMNAINPLRMINDFVKDVLTGSGSDEASKLSDPRRSGARVLFNLLPSVLESLALLWGPSNDARVTNVSRENQSPPRLSAELPRERRQALRTAALSVVEPLFQLRPGDVIACIILMFCEEQNAYGSMPATRVGEIPCYIGSHILHALDYATPDVVVTYVKSIFDKAVKWDRGSAEAVEGKAQAVLRERAKKAVQKLIHRESVAGEMKGLEAVGRMKLGGTSSLLPGGTEGLDLSQPIFPSGNTLSSTHEELFHWADFFSTFSSVVIETACLNFLEHFILTCSDGDDIQSIWPTLHSLLKDSVSTSRRKCTLPATLRVLGAFVSKNASPFPEKRYRKEIMSTSVLTISSCAALASGSSDVSQEEQGGLPEFSKELAIISLQALAGSVPKIIDSSFLEDKQQLSVSVTASLAPAISALKKGAEKAAAVSAAEEQSRRRRDATEEVLRRRQVEEELNTRASKAAAFVILQISKRDWGVKHVRRELMSLMDNSNFFYGKEDGVLEQMSEIVREVVGSGGASYILSTVGANFANGTPGIPSLFAGRDSETVIRARAIRRVAFCVFVSEPDFYAPQLPMVLEKIRDALRMSEPLLVTECLLCLRALLLRTGPTSISAFRATTLSEMFRIASNPKEDLQATLAALKFLDLISLLAPPDFSFETCFFFGEGEQLKIEVGNTLKPFTPLASKLAELWTGDIRHNEEIFQSPFRLEKGRTVLPSNASRKINEEFVGRYAAALQARNSMAKMRAAGADRETICREFELEFLM